MGRSCPAGPDRSKRRRRSRPQSPLPAGRRTSRNFAITATPDPPPPAGPRAGAARGLSLERCFRRGNSASRGKLGFETSGTLYHKWRKIRARRPLNIRIRTIRSAKFWTPGRVAAKIDVMMRYGLHEDPCRTRRTDMSRIRTFRPQIAARENQAAFAASLPTPAGDAMRARCQIRILLRAR